LLPACSNPEGDFKVAEQANTEQAYGDFIKKHPDSPLVARAKVKIQQNAFAAARGILVRSKATKHSSRALALGIWSKGRESNWSRWSLPRPTGRTAFALGGHFSASTPNQPMLSQHVAV
jgi:hypothetical protein